MKARVSLISTICLLAGSTASHADDVSTTQYGANPHLTWKLEGARDFEAIETAWVQPLGFAHPGLGSGSIGIVVDQGRLYLAGRRRVQCRDAKTGEIVWETKNDQFTLHTDTWSHRWQNIKPHDDGKIADVGRTQMAALAGDVLLVPTCDGKMFGLTTTDGSIKWTFASEGWISSANIVGDRAFFTDGRGMVVVDANSGEMLWRNDAGAAPSTASMVCVVGDSAYYGDQKGKIYKIDLKSHEVVWSTDCWADDAAANWADFSSPIAYYDGKVWAMWRVSLRLLWNGRWLSKEERKALPQVDTHHTRVVVVNDNSGKQYALKPMLLDYHIGRPAMQGFRITSGMFLFDGEGCGSYRLMESKEAGYDLEFQRIQQFCNSHKIGGARKRNPQAEHTNTGHFSKAITDSQMINFPEMDPALNVVDLATGTIRGRTIPVVRGSPFGFTRAPALYYPNGSDEGWAFGVAGCYYRAKPGEACIMAVKGKLLPK